MSTDFPGAAYDRWKTTEPDTCDPGRLGSRQARHAWTCQGCSRQMCAGDVPVEVSWLGIFCTQDCADETVYRHEQRMQWPRR